MSLRVEMARVSGFEPETGWLTVTCTTTVLYTNKSYDSFIGRTIGSRTRDPRIKSALLYQLSYDPILNGTPTWNRTTNRGLEIPCYIRLTIGVFYIGDIGGSRTHTEHALNVPPAANWATFPLVEVGTAGGIRTHNVSSCGILSSVRLANFATAAFKLICSLENHHLIPAAS